MGCSCSGPLPKEDTVADIDRQNSQHEKTPEDKYTMKKSLDWNKEESQHSFTPTPSSIIGAGSTGSITRPTYLSPKELQEVFEQPEFALDAPTVPADLPDPKLEIAEIQEKCSDLEFPSGSGVFQTRSGRFGSIVADHLGIDGFRTRVLFKATEGYEGKPEMRSYESMNRIPSAEYIQTEQFSNESDV